MTDLPTRADLFDTFAEELLSRAELRPVGDRLTAEEVYTPGSDINLIGAGASAMAEEIVRALGRSAADLTLDGARSVALDRLVADRYSPYLARKTASPARVTLTFSRPTAAAGAITLAAGTVVRTSAGVRFETLAAVAFGVLAVGPLTCSARAVEAGTTGNVASQTITAFQVAPADASIAVTNYEPAAGGDFTESDDSLRARARAFFGSARRGILAAIEQGALAVPGVRQATAEEVLNSLGVPNGMVFLYIADANGQSNLALNAAVLGALLEYRACGIIVNVYGAVPVYQSIQLTLSYTAGTDTTGAWEQVRALVVARVNSLRPGETLHRSLLTTAAKTVTGVIVADGAVVVPTGDVVPAAGQVLRTRTDLVRPSSF